MTKNAIFNVCKINTPIAPPRQFSPVNPMQICRYSIPRYSTFPVSLEAMKRFKNPRFFSHRSHLDCFGALKTYKIKDSEIGMENLTDFEQF